MLLVLRFIFFPYHLLTYEILISKRLKTIFFGTDE